MNNQMLRFTFKLLVPKNNNKKLPGLSHFLKLQSNNTIGFTALHTNLDWEWKDLVLCVGSATLGHVTLDKSFHLSEPLFPHV